jgi:alpha-galactosidase
MPKKYRFLGLDGAKTYQLNMIWPKQLKEYSPSILSKIEGQTFSGQALMQIGMQLPISFPQTSLIFELKEVGRSKLTLLWAFYNKQIGSAIP